MCSRLLLLLSGIGLASSVVLADVRSDVANMDALRSGVSVLWTNHPTVKAAVASLAAVQAEARGAGKAVYNPEIQFEYESTEVDERTIGLRQTLDWGGKREARSTVAKHQVEVAAAELRQTKYDLALSWLRAVGDHAIAVAREDLANRQLSLARRFSETARRRLEGGDMRQSDLNLALLTSAQAGAVHARAASDLAAAVAELAVFTNLSGTPAPQLPSAPSAGPLTLAASDDWSAQLPSLEVLAAQLRTVQAQIERADRDRRPDPTVGLRGGREGDEDLIGVSLEIPLHIRNRFHDQVQVTQSRALALEQQLVEAHQQARGRGEAAILRYLAVAASWRRWADAAQVLLGEQEDLLERLWESGALAAGDYLTQLQQVVNARNEGLHLRASLWQAWFDWLAATGQVARWLGIGELDS